MSIPKIPPRHPISDPFSGFLLQIDGVHILSQNEYSPAETLREGTFYIRYGVVFLGKPHLSIVPGLVALDYGEFFNGERAWDFIINKSNLHPRADVVGYRNDGEDDMIVIKALDLMHPFHILVYDSEEATKPLAHINAVIADGEQISERIAQYCPVFDSLEAWKRATS